MHCSRCNVLEYCLELYAEVILQYVQSRRTSVDIRYCSRCACGGALTLSQGTVYVHYTDIQALVS